MLNNLLFAGFGFAFGYSMVCLVQIHRLLNRMSKRIDESNQKLKDTL